MWAHSILLALLITILAVQIASSKCTIASTKPAPTEHEIFFNRLSAEEQLWLMNLAIMYHDADDMGFKPLPITSDEISSSSFIDSFGGMFSENDIPQTLVSHFLNGNVPKHWQKQFTTWLTKEFNMTASNFELYKETGSLCKEKGKCPEIKNIGGICCPFG